jgi:hypothetical protein
VLLGEPRDEAGHLVGAPAGAGRDDELDRLGRLPGRGRERAGDDEGDEEKKKKKSGHETWVSHRSVLLTARWSR